MTTHRHRAVPKLAKVVGYTAPVNWPGNPAAHGGVCVIDTCRCGYWRATNVNGVHVERGSWEAPAPRRTVREVTDGAVRYLMEDGGDDD